MNKTYLKDGNSKRKGKKYCWKHFIERYKREPNIMDTAHFSSCSDCEVELI